MIICIILLIVLFFILYYALSGSIKRVEGGVLNNHNGLFNIPSIDRSPYNIMEYNPPGTVSLLIAIDPVVYLIKLFKPVIFLSPLLSQYLLSEDIVIGGELIPKYSVAEMHAWLNDEFMDSRDNGVFYFKNTKLKRIMIDWGFGGGVIADAKKLRKMVDWIDIRNGRIILSINAYAECADPILKDIYICRLYKNQFGMPYKDRDMSWVNSPEFGLENSWSMFPRYIYDTYENEKLSQDVRNQFLLDWGLTPETYNIKIKSKIMKEYDNIALLPFLISGKNIKDIESKFKDLYIDYEKHASIIDSIMEANNALRSEDGVTTFSTKLAKTFYKYLMTYVPDINDKDFNEFFIYLPITRALILKGCPQNTSLDTLNEVYRYKIYKYLRSFIDSSIDLGGEPLRRIIKYYKESYDPDIPLTKIEDLKNELKILGIEWNEFIEYGYIVWGNGDIGEGVSPARIGQGHYDTYMELQVVDYYVPKIVGRPNPKRMSIARH